MRTCLEPHRQDACFGERFVRLELALVQFLRERSAKSVINSSPSQHDEGLMTHLSAWNLQLREDSAVGAARSR